MATENRARGWLAAGATLLLGVATLPALADPPQFRSAQLVQAPGLGTNNTFAIPCVTDWNGDGRKDLLVGYQTAGKIALYTNSGTDASPVFTNFANLQYYDSVYGWQDIIHVSGGCGAPCPWVCDFDNDGKRDLLVGAGADGTVWFYRNTNTDAAPKLIQAGQLKVGTNALAVGGYRSSPCVTDWDQDGLNDLLCGAGDGYVYFFRNTNSASAPIFAPGQKIQAGGVDLRLNQIQGGGTDSTPRSVVRVLDWNGDGLKDLVLSSDTGVYWCRNTNNNSNPMLEAPVAITAASTNTLASIITGPVPGARMRVFPVDWNDDGVMDLLVGDYSGKVYYFQGYSFAFTGLCCDAGRVTLRWNSASNLSYTVLTGASPALIQGIAVSNWPSGGNTTCWTNLGPPSPLFYRVQITQ